MSVVIDDRRYCTGVSQTHSMGDVILYSDAYENKKHQRFAVSDTRGKPPSDFSLLLKSVLSDVGTGDCPVSFVVS